MVLPGPSCPAAEDASIMGTIRKQDAAPASHPSLPVWREAGEGSAEWPMPRTASQQPPACGSGNSLAAWAGRDPSVYHLLIQAV